MISEKPARWIELLDELRHDESVALNGEGRLVELRIGQYLVRIEGTRDTGPGNWFCGPFVTPGAAGEYARFLAALGRQGIRERCALPEFWSPRSAGNPVEVLRTYRVDHEAPGISSAAARQREGAAPRAGGSARGYEGEGWQVTLPCRSAKVKFGIALVSRVPGAELAVSKP